MAKASNSVIGVDLGRYALKSVRLQRRGADRVEITHYASRPLTEALETAEQLGRELKALLKQMGGSAKAWNAAVSSDDTLLRIIEQPETPPELLREALRINGMLLMNQDCRNFVLDCDRIPDSSASQPLPTETPTPGPRLIPNRKYLIGGIPRVQVTRISEAMGYSSSQPRTLQLAPVSLYNAFEFAYPRIFDDQAFFPDRYRSQLLDDDARREERISARAQHRLRRKDATRNINGTERRIA
jgi:hypothetical protein